MWCQFPFRLVISKPIRGFRGKLFFAEVDSRALEYCRRQEAKIGDSMVISVDHASSQFLIEIERKL